MLIKQKGFDLAQKVLSSRDAKYKEFFVRGYEDGYFAAKREALAIVKEQIASYEKSGVQYPPFDVLDTLRICIEADMSDSLNVYFIGTEGSTTHSFRCSSKQEACERMVKWLGGTYGEMKMCIVVPDGFKIGDPIFDEIIRD